MLFWDLDACNHEITTLKIGNICLRERYAEGEIPYNTKTGGGPILLACSFPYVRDWLNKHPFKNTPQARLICSLRNGAPITPEALWTMMKQLRMRIARMLESGAVDNEKELMYLSWFYHNLAYNPAAITQTDINEFVSHYSAPGGMRAGFEYYRAFPQVYVVHSWSTSFLLRNGSSEEILSHNTSGISYADSTPVSSDITTNNKMG
jgi:hypothetical protein